MPGEGHLATCRAWPGPEGACALVETAWARFLDRRRMERLHEVGRALVSEQNLDRLLDLILVQARRLLDAEAGSLYLVVGEGEDRELLFAHTQNAAVDLPYHRFRMPISPDSMAGFVAATGRSLNIPDVQELGPDAPYRFNDSFDRRSGYRSRSMLVVPLLDVEGQVLGVLQLINRLEEDAEGRRTVVPFLREHVGLAQSLAGQAGVAVRNARLREEIERLFEGFVQASVTAIEARDPSTSGHSSRVADLTVALGEAVNATPTGPYGAVHFTEQQLKEVRYAGLLHDFGKVGVREEVLVKAKKLQPDRLDRILQRLYQRDLEIVLELMTRAWDEGAPKDAAPFHALLQARRAESRRLVELVQRCNEPTVLPLEIAEQMDELESLEFVHHGGEAQRIFEPGDIAALRIPKGSLSEEEREEINSHVTHTFRFLRQIPWTGGLKDLPEIAYAHHERLNGRGYPRGLVSEQIPVQSKLMAIADVYDALVASDRPYKAAVSVPKSLQILEDEAKAGLLDAEALRIFMDAKIFELTISRFRV